MEAYASADPDGIQRLLEDFQSVLAADSIDDDDLSSNGSSALGGQDAGHDDLNTSVKRKGSSGSASSDCVRRSVESDRSAKHTSDMIKNDPTPSVSDLFSLASVSKRKLVLEPEHNVQVIPPVLSFQGQDDEDLQNSAR
jgi:hypothetical protein